MRHAIRPLIATLLLLACQAAYPLDLLVESSADTGDQSLRFAMQKANIATEDTTITFADNVSIINITTPLPIISNPNHAITIDGGGDVRIDGNLLAVPAVALEIRSSNVTVHGLVLTNFIAAGIYLGGDIQNVDITGCLIGTDGNIVGPNGDGIVVAAASNVTIGGATPALRNVISGNQRMGIVLFSNAGPTTIQGNYIGTTPDGELPLGNGVGIKVEGGTGHTIGGDQSGQGNVISGNSSTMGAALWFALAGAGSTVRGNIIGLNATGTSVLPNAANGIAIDNVDNIQLGGTSALARNVISGNSGSGIINFFSDNTTIQGNYIGVNAAGTGSFPNNRGIYIENSENIQIGGAVSGAGNVISSNTLSAILQMNGGSVIIQGNTIGMDASRQVALGNGGSGISLADASGTIGGLSAAAGNLVAHNFGAGIEFSGGVPVTIRRNSIFSNTADGLQQVIPGLNRPVITSVNPITGTGPASSTIELFADDDGEGRIYLGSAVTDASGNFSSPLKLGAFRSMTLTGVAINSFGFSSRFSDPVEIKSPNEAHSADTDANLKFDLSEILRLIQFYNNGAIACASPIGSTEDGYATEGSNFDCVPHASDYAPQDWTIGLSELLRAIQIFNVGAYFECLKGGDNQDGFCTTIALP